MAGGDEFAVSARERAVVDGELHLDRGRIEFGPRHGLAFLAVAQRLADGEFLETRDADDVARLTVDDFAGLEAAKFPDLRHGGAFALAVFVNAHDGVADLDGTAGDLADGNTTHVITPIEVTNEHLEWRLNVGCRGWDVLQNGFKQRRHAIGDRIAELFHRVSVA